MRSNIFESAAVALYRCGYSVVPILSVDAPFDSRGKAPGVYGGLSADGTKGPWYLLKEWQEYCTTRASEAKAASWGRMADAMGGGLGIACGYGGLVAIDCDSDDLIEPIRAILPPILVEKVGRKGFTAFYRSNHPRDDAEWWKKKNYGLEIPDPDHPGKQKRVGLLDFIAAGSQTVAPPSPHKDTGEPYRWTTERTLINTPLEALPLFTDAHRDAMERVLREHGWVAPKPTVARSKATAERLVVGASSDDMLWHDDVNGAALANLSAWVEELRLPKGHWRGVSYRAVAPWRTSGSGRADARRSPNLSFHPTGIEDFGDRKWTPIRIVAKARGIPFPAAAAWLRAQLGLPEEHLILANAGTVKPTYPDRAVTLTDATKELCDTLDDFEAEMKAWRIYRNATIKPPLIHRKPPIWGVKIATSGGKSFHGARKVAEWTKSGWRLVYAVPTISLGEQVKRVMADHDIKARIYRGREQDDPNAPGKRMCQNLPAANAAIDLGLSVPPAVCMRRIDGVLVRCPFANVCGYERQRDGTPDVWIVTFASLLYEKPDFLPELDGIVADEKFHDKAIAESVVVDTTELWRARIELCSDNESDFLTDMRAKLRAVANDNGNGPLSRAALNEHRVFVHAALRAAILEQRRVRPEILRPDMKESGLNLALKNHGARNKLARDVETLWEQIALFLAFDHPLSGRITVAGSTFIATPLRSFYPSWHAPVLALDATLTIPEILDAAVLGDEIVGIPSTVSLKADIDIQWPDCVHVQQVLHAPITMGSLGLGEKAKPHPNNERDIARYICRQAAMIAPARLGVISYLGLEERLAGKVPENVRWMHFGATSGLNDFESVAGIVIIGRWWLSPERVEATASVFAAYPVKPLGEYYRKRTGGIRKTEGPAIPATVESHPDPFAEAVRWDVTVGELVQAIGRLRAPRRNSPCFLDILSDVVLPITVDEVVEWDSIRPKAEADMMVQGVVLANSRDAKIAFNLTKWDAENAETVPESLIGVLIKKTGTVSPLRRFTYRREDARGPVSNGYFLPAILPERELKAWLETKLGPLASLEIERRDVWMGGVV